MVKNDKMIVSQQWERDVKILRSHCFFRTLLFVKIISNLKKIISNVI